MKRKLLNQILALTVLGCFLPSLTLAWSWQSLFSGDKDHADKAIISSLDAEKADEKFNVWAQAIADKSLLSVISDNNNFIFGEAEANFIATRMLESAIDPLMTSPKVEFEPGFIRLSGYLLKPVSGHIELEIAVYPEGEILKFTTLRARYRNFYIPQFLANRLLEKSSQDILETLYTYPEYTGMEVVVKDDRLFLRYY